MKIDRSKAADIVFWTSLAILVLWALAKSFRLIHTPVIIEMIPLFAIVFAADAAWNRFIIISRYFHRFTIDTNNHFRPHQSLNWKTSFAVFHDFTKNFIW